MKINSFAGKLAEPGMPVNIPQLITAYYTGTLDPSLPDQIIKEAQIIVDAALEVKEKAL
jgi:hypothetical protein